MRLDQFLSRIGVIKRRTMAKEIADKSMIKVNGQKAKPAYEVKLGDVIAVMGSRPTVIEVLDIPKGSVKKEDREQYFKKIE